ncbi:MAG: radical SAM protein [Lentisphaeria bacterium]|nr:radical SAM protein [Lentisphaeria bacterium]
MILRLAKRMLTEPSPRLVARFAYQFGWKGMRAVQRFQKRILQGDSFPAFIFLSITNSCNLKCQGCWVTPSDPPTHMPLEVMDRIVSESKKEGASFFGLLGGEPLLHPQLFDLIGRHRDCYFQVFTNGTLLDGAAAAEMRRLGNVTPLVSIEGLEAVSDERRGGTAVFSKALDALEHCRRERLITGVATSVCKSNMADLASDEFARRLIDLGVMYLWYYLYRPVGPRPCPELALDPDEIVELRQFLVDLRLRVPLAIVDAYWDAEGQAMCPAATGISHHISPGGDIEPCPVIQFACENVQDGPSLREQFDQSLFLSEFRQFASQRTRGCVIMECPDELRAFADRLKARDSSGRGTARAELDAIRPHCSHHVPGREIPERHWAYRFAKKHWFFGFGAYG